MGKGLTWAVKFIIGIFLLIQLFIGMGEAMGIKSGELNKKAILVVAFGTSYSSGQKALNNVQTMLKKEFPETPIYWAYTSKIIRHILAKRGVSIPSPEMALAELMDKGYKTVYILSLHVIPGKEYHLLYSNAKLFSLMENGIKEVKVSSPLIATYEDMEKVAEVVLKSVHLKENEAIVFMGHGTEHPANAIYIALNSIINNKNSRAFLATVEGHPTIYDIIPELKKQGIRTVYLMPFMLVAGDHANNDMAGDEPDSWKSILTKEGFVCKPIIKGLGENPEIVKIYIEHLKEIMK
jgi:sirohydrochlorin cobaltochelatase